MNTLRIHTILSLALLWLASSLQAAELVQPPRPNIVVILCDDLGYGDLVCYGHPHIKTPHLNRLAADGIRFTDCYSAAPVCSPSRVGLLTGRSPNRAGVYDWIPPARAEKADARDLVHLSAGEPTIASLLRQGGYATCMSGKWHCNSKFNSVEQPQPGDAGFDHWFGTQNNAAPSHQNPVNYVRNGEEVGKLEGYSCQLATSEAIEWIERHQASNRTQPFFVYLAFHEPHEPVASPADLVAEYRSVARNDDEAHYFANVANVDKAVGRLVTRLDELKLRQNTLIVFTSDNGPETLNRYRSANRSFGTPDPLRGMKLWTTDAGFRVAGIMNWPARITQGRVESQPVSSLDFLPTFCGLAGVTPPADRTLDGTNILGIIDGKTLDRQQPLVWCYYNSLNEHQVAMRHQNWKLLAKLDSGKLTKMQNIHSGNADRARAAQLTDFELYRISDDVHESQNLIDSEETAESLKGLMRSEYEKLVRGSKIWDR